MVIHAEQGKSDKFSGGDTRVQDRKKAELPRVVGIWKSERRQPKGNRQLGG